MAEYAKFGKFAFTAKLRNGLFRNTGACLSPQTAFYNLLGMETLGLRMERACDNAKKLAEFLNTYPDVTVYGMHRQRKFCKMDMEQFLQFELAPKSVRLI